MNVQNRVEDHRTAYPSVASENTTVMQASEFMTKNNIRHLPVVKLGKVVGIVLSELLTSEKGVRF